jgi:hypothetical protein
MAGGRSSARTRYRTIRFSPHDPVSLGGGSFRRANPKKTARTARPSRYHQRVAGGQPFRAAPVSSPNTTETRGGGRVAHPDRHIYGSSSLIPPVKSQDKAISAACRMVFWTSGVKAIVRMALPIVPIARPIQSFRPRRSDASRK